MTVSSSPIIILLIAVGYVSAAEKLPVPAPSDVAKAEKEIKDLFKAEYAKTKLADKSKLAEALFKEAEETKDAPVSVYVLLSESQRLALQGNNFELAHQAAKTLIEQYEVDAAMTLKVLFENMVKYAGTKDSVDAAVRILLDAQQQAIAADQFGVALDYQKLLEVVVRKTRHIPTISAVTQSGNNIVAMRAAYEKYKPALAELANKPDDPDLNLAVGRYLCFTKGDWERGVAFLSKSGDSKLKAVAEREMAAPDTSAQQVALADAWYELTIKQDVFVARQIRRRAYYWYEKAVGDLTGLTKQRVSKRMEELSTLAPESGSGGTIHDYVRLAVRRNKIDANTPEHGGDFADKPFKSMAPDGGILIGFNIATSKFGADIDYISSIQPIYRVAKGEKTGMTHGKPLPIKFTTLKAKAGFAVGKIHVLDGGNLDQLSITFMKVRRTSLDPAGSYKSAVVGTKVDKAIVDLDGKGQPIIGLHGKESDGGSLKIGIVIPDADAIQPKKKTLPK